MVKTVWLLAARYEGLVVIPIDTVRQDYFAHLTTDHLIRKINAPEDISLILLNEQMEADWFVPKLACFRFPVTRLASLLARWVDGQTLVEYAGPLSADFEAGESIAVPPGKSA